MKDTNSRVDFSVDSYFVHGAGRDYWTKTGNTTISEFIKNAGKPATYKLMSGH